MLNFRLQYQVLIKILYYIDQTLAIKIDDFINFLLPNLLIFVNLTKVVHELIL